jgi:hypothetical protein
MESIRYIQCALPGNEAAVKTPEAAAVLRCIYYGFGYEKIADSWQVALTSFNPKVLSAHFNDVGLDPYRLIHH